MTETPQYVIRDYAPGDERNILTSFNRVFREVVGPDFVDRDLATWRWVYPDNPAGFRIKVAVVAGEDTIAAHYGGIPQDMHAVVGGVEQRGWQFVHAVDSFVVPEHRAGLKKPGLFVNTAEPWFADCIAEGIPVIYGYPVVRAMRIGQRYLGYQPMRSIDYLLCEPGELAARDLPGGIEIVAADAIPEGVDALFAGLAGDLGEVCLVRRDRRYLQWRYCEGPQASDFTVFVARRGGSVAGLVVTRNTELAPGSLAIADLVVRVDDEDVFAALIQAAAKQARQRGRERLLAIAPPWSRTNAGLLGLGFAPESSAQWHERVLSHRILQPEPLTPEWLEGHWYYTLGDSDLI